MNVLAVIPARYASVRLPGKPLVPIAGKPMIQHVCERDAEGSAANDYAVFRYDMNRLGRFSSPDPLAGSIADPQSLNRYAYTRNDPVNLVDPFGLDWCYDPTSFTYYWCISVTVTITGAPTGSGDRANGISDYFRFLWPFSNASTSHVAEERPTRFELAEERRGLGIRAPGQTFNQCMQANAGNYSLLGVADFALGANGQIADNVALGFTPASNQITTAYNALAGSLTSLFQTGPNIVETGMGSVTTYGRRTSSVMSMNIPGTPGGPKGGFPALGSAPSNASQASKAALGQFKVALDVGFFLAEAVGCAGPAKP